MDIKVPYEPRDKRYVVSIFVGVFIKYKVVRKISVYIGHYFYLPVPYMHKISLPTQIKVVVSLMTVLNERKSPGFSEKIA